MATDKSVLHDGDQEPMIGFTPDIGAARSRALHDCHLVRIAQAGHIHGSGWMAMHLGKTKTHSDTNVVARAFRDNPALPRWLQVMTDAGPLWPTLRCCDRANWAEVSESLQWPSEW